MTKNDLIFDWSDKEVHRGWKGASVFLVVIGFALMFSILSVSFDYKDLSSQKSASALFLSDQNEARFWQMKAVEEGPFPGGFEISGIYDPLNDIDIGTLGVEDSWNPYQLQMRSLDMESSRSKQRIATQGQRVFPRILKSSDKVNFESRVPITSIPMLIPYTKESEAWLPSDYPPIEMNLADGGAPAEWRYILNLNAEGGVKECFALSWGSEDGVKAMNSWISGLKFQKAEVEDRWMGLRIEFLNERAHGTDVK